MIVNNITLHLVILLSIPFTRNSINTTFITQRQFSFLAYFINIMNYNIRNYIIILFFSWPHDGSNNNAVKIAVGIKDASMSVGDGHSSNASETIGFEYFFIWSIFTNGFSIGIFVYKY